MKKIITYSIFIGGFFGIFASFSPIALAGYYNSTPIARCEAQITRYLQRGSENSDVYVMQQLLGRSGYMYASPNGYFGPSTEAAVKRFQKANYISQTGTVGPQTRDAMNERICDQDPVGESLSYYSYDSYYGNTGYNSGTTYVGKEDPYVQVINPTPSIPLVYNNPPSSTAPYLQGTANTQVISNNTFGSTLAVNPINTAIISNSNVSTNINANTASQIASVNIIYTPSVGYIYSIIPKTGSLTITSPVRNSSYREGDTVSLSWYTNNLPTNQFQIILENTNTRQSRAVAFTSSNSASFVLTKELLDAVCSNSCTTNNQGAFRFIIATPTTDIAGVTSVMRANIDSITITRPLGVGTVSITASKTPVSSGEVFNLYVNIPANSVPSNGNNYSFKMRAICVNAVQVSIAGVPCGQDFSFPVDNAGVQQQVPVKITNTTFFKQDVSFEIVLINNVNQVVSVGTATVSVNAAPFNW